MRVYWITANTERFASLGYVALAVDLYRGKSTADPSVAHELMRGVPEDRALADLKAAFNLLSTRPDVDPKRPQDVQAFRDALKAAGKDADIKSYSTVGHAFMNPNNTGGYDATAANDAWKRIDAFFSRTLVDRK